MERPRICAVIASNDPGAIGEVEPFIELFEVRIDLIGDGWQEVAKHLRKPWVACNRIADEGGSWKGDEGRRIDELVKAAELGADMVDIELGTKGLEEAMLKIGGRVKYLLSFHDLRRTPPLDEMKSILQRQLDAGADICKVVTTAQGFEDNLSVLGLITQFSETRIISFAMGPLGVISRVLCPLVGGEFTYASIEKGRESAPGQITARDLRQIYDMVANGK